MGLSDANGVFSLSSNSPEGIVLPWALPTCLLGCVRWLNTRLSSDCSCCRGAESWTSTSLAEASPAFICCSCPQASTVTVHFYGLVHWEDPMDECLGPMPCHCSPLEGAVTKEGMMHYKAGTSYLGKEHWKTCFVVLRWEPWWTAQGFDAPVPSRDLWGRSQEGMREMPPFTGIWGGYLVWWSVSVRPVISEPRHPWCLSATDGPSAVPGLLRGSILCPSPSLPYKVGSWLPLPLGFPATVCGGSLGSGPQFLG